MGKTVIRDTNHIPKGHPSYNPGMGYSVAYRYYVFKYTAAFAEGNLSNLTLAVL